MSEYSRITFQIINGLLTGIEAKEQMTRDIAGSLPEAERLPILNWISKQRQHLREEQIIAVA